ncbi:MAG: pitrilysin family protein [Nakamurella sp.]
MPRVAYPVNRATLDNGLRVVLSPDRGSGVVGISVHVDVGFRSEPVGRTGFAHLFEHLMFQGSESLPKLEHFRVVQSSGGTFNGSTHFDYTEYHELLPAGALERGLFLEADRFRAPAITAENLANQVDVVSEEIRLNVLNRPYGGFPWIYLPPVLFDTFANSHNGYGDFADLTAATVDDCADFFERYYCPANSVLTVCGDIDIDETMNLIHRHFDDVPYRPAPERPDFSEPAPTSRKVAEHIDVQAPSPALAVGWRLPDPVSDLRGYLAYLLLGAVLADGEAAPLQTELVNRQALATSAWAGPGLMGPLDSRDPDVFVLGALHPLDIDADAVIDAARAIIEDMATHGPDAAQLQQAKARFTASLLSECDSVMARTRNLGLFELLHGRAELVGELPSIVDSLGAEDVARAAAALDPDRCAVLRVVPGGQQ